MHIKSFLIIDDDESFYSELKCDELYNKIPIITESTAAKAINAVKEGPDLFYAVFVSIDADKPDCLSIVKALLMVNPLLSIFLIESMKSSSTPKSSDKNLAVKGSISKPFKVKDLHTKAHLQINFYNSDDAINLSKKYKESINEELEVTNEEFFSVRIDQFLSGANSIFDIYIKLRENKYVKVLGSGDVFDVKRLNTYVEKGVLYLYIRTSLRDQYIKYCDSLNQKIVKLKKVDLSKKFGLLFNQAEVMLSKATTLGVSNDDILYCQRYIKNTLNVVDALKEEDNIIKSLLSNLADFEHSISVSIFVALLAKEMSHDSDATHSILGVASLFHDVGFCNEVQKEVEVRYTEIGKKSYSNEEELLERLKSSKCFANEKNTLKKIYEEHAITGAEYLNKNTKIDSVVTQIIQGHHFIEHRQELAKKQSSVHPLSHLIEISNELVFFLESVDQSKLSKDRIKNTLIEIAEKYPSKTKRTFINLFKLNI